jgi:hypothetical protein
MTIFEPPKLPALSIGAQDRSQEHNFAVELMSDLGRKRTLLLKYFG